MLVAKYEGERCSGWDDILNTGRKHGVRMSTGSNSGSAQHPAANCDHDSRPPGCIKKAWYFLNN